MKLNAETANNRWRVRPDGPDKVTGALRYLTDLTVPDMLHGKVLRSPHPHAWILAINTEKAERLPGVHAVITHRDVPGMNRFGIVMPDQPVLCEDRVRYVGDAVAAIAAETEELAEYALTLIEVDYEPLPAVDDAVSAMRDDAPRLHPGGNVLHRAGHARGDAQAAFARCAHVVEITYATPRQMHTYMETEGGLFIPEEDGKLTVYAATQHGFKDQMQLARILAVPESDIRVVSSPIGGSFGGKDELNVQPYGSLLALKSGRPVRMHNSRAESVRAGIKRHPTKVTMKTGVDETGKLVAHQVRIVADTGAYATLGPAVLNFAVEHSIGAYNIPHVDVQGVSVYTNNGVSGEFRGFGGNQVIFALEGQMDRLAHKLGLDPLELRRINLRRMGDSGPFGHRIAQTDGAMQTFEAVAKSAVWQRRSTSGAKLYESDTPWIRRGVGANVVMHGYGFGFGLPDPAGGRLTLTKEGKIEAAFGYEEFGQGLLGALELMLLDTFGCGEGDIAIVIGDTARVPHSGSSTASRTTTLIWQSLQRLAPQFREAVTKRAAELTQLPVDRLELGSGGVYVRGSKEIDDARMPVATYREIAERGELQFHTSFHFPTTPDAVMGGHYLYTYASAAVEVEVNLLTGRVKLIDQFHAVAAGPVVNPMGFLGQIEGGSAMALGFTLTEDAVMQESRYVTKNLDSYLIPTIADIPFDATIEAIEQLPEGDPHGPRGVGEVGTVALAPAIAAAIQHATGVWVEKLPVEPEALVAGEAFWKETLGV